VSDEAGTKPEGADPTKAAGEEPVNPNGNGAPAAGQSAPAGTQSGLSEQEIAEYRAWKDALGAANVTDPRSLAADYTRKAQRAAELEQELSREREALDILRGRERQAADPEAAAYEAYRLNPYDPDAQRAWLEARDAKRTPEILRTALAQIQLGQRLPQAGEMLGITDQQQLARTLHGVGSTLTPDELALVELKRRGKAAEYLSRETKQLEEQAQRASALDQFGSVRGAPRIPGSNPDDGVKPIPFEEWAALNDAAKDRLRKSSEKFAIVGAPKHFNPATD
jgi:hypothetical protein